MRHPFEVGGTYGNRVGSYQVVSIDQRNMVVRYDDGKLLHGDVETFARIWENMQLEAEAAQIVPATDVKPKGKSQRKGR